MPHRYFQSKSAATKPHKPARSVSFDRFVVLLMRQGKSRLDAYGQATIAQVFGSEVLIGGEWVKIAQDAPKQE